MNTFFDQISSIITLVFFLIFLGACADNTPSESTLDAALSSDTERVVSDLDCFMAKASRPQITKLSYMGQVPLKPHTLIFHLEWSDDGRDLAGGSYQFLIDGIKQKTVLLDKKGVSNKKSGTLILYLKLPKITYPQGSHLCVGLIIFDAEQLDSNLYQLCFEAHK